MNMAHLELRGRIKASGRTAATMARSVGISESHMHNILCARSFPTIDLAYDIIREVGGEPSEIYKLFPPGGISPDQVKNGIKGSRTIIRAGRK